MNPFIYKTLPFEERKALELSPHFSAWECECKCGCGMHEPEPELLEALESLRALIGKPIITRWEGGGSVCRCRAHNTAEGGGRHSQHLLGKAADIRIPGFTPLEVFILAENIPLIKGRGLYNTFTHIDVRPERAVWDNRT